jgi:hypothetical protein
MDHCNANCEVLHTYSADGSEFCILYIRHYKGGEKIKHESFEGLTAVLLMIPFFCGHDSAPLDNRTPAF